MFGSLQGENLIALRAGNQHSIHLTHADGAKRFFEFRDATLQIANFL
jgi:hypothetical protein